MLHNKMNVKLLGYLSVLRVIRRLKIYVPYDSINNNMRQPTIFHAAPQPRPKARYGYHFYNIEPNLCTQKVLRNHQSTYITCNNNSKYYTIRSPAASQL